jgi:hypothetical protein
MMAMGSIICTPTACAFCSTCSTRMHSSAVQVWRRVTHQHLTVWATSASLGGPQATLQLVSKTAAGDQQTLNHPAPTSASIYNKACGSDTLFQKQSLQSWLAWLRPAASCPAGCVYCYCACSVWLCLLPAAAAVTGMRAECCQ